MTDLTLADIFSTIKTCDNFINSHESGEHKLSDDAIARFRKDKAYFQSLIPEYMCKSDWVHPEQKDGEVFLLNVKDDEDWGCPPFCHSVRRGEVAYTTGGKEIVKEMKPLFGLLKK